MNPQCIDNIRFLLSSILLHSAIVIRVGISVCLSVCNTSELCQKGRVFCCILISYNYYMCLIYSIFLFYHGTARRGVVVVCVWLFVRFFVSKIVENGERYRREIFTTDWQRPTRQTTPTSNQRPINQHQLTGHVTPTDSAQNWDKVQSSHHSDKNVISDSLGKCVHVSTSR